jgi:hypothetical protein
MRITFNEESSEAMLLVDAQNAFNAVNRKVALKNIKELCPPYYRFLNNCYQTPTKLFLSGSGNFIYSEEGATQGDPAAMQMYALSTNPLINKVSLKPEEKSVQTWYADDSAACGKLEKLEEWWLKLCEHGPNYGYHPNAKKTVLIVKDWKHMPDAQVRFSKYNVKITCEGERHLGAVIGSDQFRESYINDKVSGWVADVKELTSYAEDDPQIAYCAFVKGLSLRWQYVQRTVANIGHLFQPLEKCIREEFIPNIVGRQISDKERRLFALPLRYGGLGIQDPTETSDREYKASTEITEDLTNLILQQNQDVTQLDKAKMVEHKKTTKLAREGLYKAELDDIMKDESDSFKRVLETATERGSYLWLSVLPLKDLGFILNKVEFLDAIALRYNWSIKGTPKQCECGVKNDLDHLLICKKGGYIIMRHNDLRDAEAELMKEAGGRNVSVEPLLIPTRGDHLKAQTTKGYQARLDVAATGIWNKFERTFFDIRVTHPNAPSNKSKDLKKLYKSHENQKKRFYEERIIENEKGTFCPLVFSTTGGVGEMCERHHKRVAELISLKRKEKYADVMKYIRTKLRFTLLRSLLMSLRGTRGKQQYREPCHISEVSFGLIPEDPFYEA